MPTILDFRCVLGVWDFGVLEGVAVRSPLGRRAGLWHEGPVFLRVFEIFPETQPEHYWLRSRSAKRSRFLPKPPRPSQHAQKPAHFTGFVELLPTALSNSSRAANPSPTVCHRGPVTGVCHRGPSVTEARLWWLESLSSAITAGSR